MSQFQSKDLTGQRFGRLTVVRYAGSQNRHALWECQCDCGGIKIAQRGNLIRGFTSSCGCYRREWGARRAAELHRTRKKRPTTS